MKKKLTLFICVMMAGISFAQDASKNTTIFWDASFSMADRVLEKDLEVLQKIFDREGNQEVQVVFFDIGIKEKEYQIREGNWDLLKQDLLAVQYDGASIYKNLNKRAKYPNVYIFTDGNKLVSNDALSLKAKSYIINSSPTRDEDFLKRTALISRSRLMDFASILPENIGGLKKKTADDATQLLKGTVYIDNKPAANVKVAVKGISDSFLTDAKGNFQIAARPGDSLLVSSRASNTLKTVPIKSTETLAVFMKANVFALDEVVLVEKRHEEQKLVATGYGLENKEKLGYASQSLGDEDITPIQTNVSQSIQNRFSNVNLGNSDAVGGTEDISRVTMRSNTSLLYNNYSLIVLDGVPQRQSDSSRDGAAPQARFDHLDPENIESISVLKGLAATNRYGSLGANGVILITTKGASNKGIKGAAEDRARLKNNVYKADEASEKVSVSPYTKALQTAKSDQEAYTTYLSLRNFNTTNMSFYMDVFHYFKERNPDLAVKVISNLLELFPDDLKKLRTTAMSFSVVGAYEEAIQVNQQVLSLNPNNQQAHLNIALAKRDLGQHQEALDYFVALAEGFKFPNLSTSGISKTVNREIRNLLFKHKGTLNTTKVDEKYLNNLRFNVRLVFEWNDPGHEFAIQFVNPQNRFFNWEHTNAVNASRIKDEIMNGYSNEEFEFYGDVKGKWIINANYLGSLSEANKESLVLKCSLYNNYGYPNESKEEILIQFTDRGDKRNLKTLFIK